MKALAFFILVAIVSLLGCSNTIVHLHANDLPKADQENIRTGLEEKGFSVLRRENGFPSEGNTILYSPHKGIEKDLRAIEEVLGNNGLKAERSYAIHTNKIGTHEYTAGNIGLYIVPAVRQEHAEATTRVRSVFPITMTDAEFVSTDCPTEYGYQFENDTVTVDDFSLAMDKTGIATLDWHHASDDIIVISNDGEQFKYKKTESHREYSNQYSHHIVTYHIWLRPLDYYRVPFGCTYKSTYTEAF